MHYILGILVLMACMAARDTVYTALTIYEAHGYARKAGIADALGDIISILYTLIGVDTLNSLGFSIKSIILMCCVAFTSYETTLLATRYLTKRENAKIVPTKI